MSGFFDSDYLNHWIRDLGTPHQSADGTSHGEPDIGDIRALWVGFQQEN